MLNKKQKAVNEALRRNIWRSLLILKSASVSDLLAVVRGLTTRKARGLLHELETHGYLTKTTKHGRPEYSHAVDSPSLPSVCTTCKRPFDAKACTPKGKKAKLTVVASQAEPAQTATDIASLEVNHDAA